MRKIPTLYTRTEDRRGVTDEVTPGCEWVLAGEGVATRKWDGTCVMRDDLGSWFARREVKPGKTPPSGFILEQHDDITGKSVGWAPIEQSPFVTCWEEAVNHAGDPLTPGTYELVGPKINGNPDRMQGHRLQRHATSTRVDSNDYPYETPKALVKLYAHPHHGWEGIVWHHPDGRMAKLKARDL